MQAELVNVSKRFGRTKALDRATLSFAEGEIVAVVGANGAGKTTLLQLLAGVLAPSEGEVRYDGEAFRRDRLDIRKRFFYLPDKPEVFGSDTVLDHVAMVVRLYEAPEDDVPQRTLELLQAFDILPLIETPLRELSRGQKYKAALVASLVIAPELWMLDEPFASGMDPTGINSFRREAQRHVDQGGTVLYTTQIVDLAAQFSSRICVIDSGSVHACAPHADLQQQAIQDETLARILAVAESEHGL